MLENKTFLRFKPFQIPLRTLALPTFMTSITHKLLLPFLFLLLSLQAIIAQPGRGMPGNGQQAGGNRMPAIGRIYGKLIDAKTKQPVEYATITILNQRDSVINGGLSKANGDFSIEKLPLTKLKVKIQFIGYKPSIIPTTLTFSNAEIDIGNIKMEIDTKVLNEVVISEQKQAVVIGVDRRIYNVDKDISSRGGTAVDVMKNIPGLTVDADGNVSLRNQSPTIFIDGRPTTLTMEQLPSEQIDRIEVITNPSAKFDASASGGIVNVVMKKNTKPGYNGMIGSNIGTIKFDDINRLGVNGNINIKENRINFFLSYNLNYNNNPTLGYTNRITLDEGVETGSYNQNNQNNQERRMQNGRFGFDYTISNRNTLTLSQSLMGGGFTTFDQQTFNQTGMNGVNTGSGTRTNDQTNAMQNATTQAMWKHTFPKQGKEWTADLTYNMGQHKSNSLFTTYNYDSLLNPFPNNPQLQRNTGTGKSQVATFQFDFTNPLTDTARLEFGLKSNIKLSETGMDVEQFNQTSGEYVADSFLTSAYTIRDMTNAVYVNYTNMFMGIGYQAGLRFEATRFTGENKGLSFEYLYPDGTKNLGKAFFPSLFLSKKIDPNNEFQFNFSRKINRPGWMQIIPFIMFSDKNNYQIGNPSLAPEFTNLSEINYNHIFGFGNWLTSGYIRYTQSPITPYVYQSPTDSNVLISTFINGDKNVAGGWENNIKLSLVKKKLDFNWNVNIFYTQISASEGTMVLSNEGISWNSKTMLSYKLPKQFTVQVNGNYEAPRIIAQGKTKEVYSIDFSISKDIGKKLTFNFTINDIFNTRGFGSYYTTDLFTQELWRRRETRFFRLGFTYRFGEWDVSLFKRKNTKRQESQGSDQGEF